MSVYLHDIPLHEAQALLKAALDEAGLADVLGEETISVDENALGRTLSQAVWAKISSPHYHASAMDGFAVVAAETDGAGPGLPVTLRNFEYVDTGDALPDGFNAVIMIEDVEPLDAHGELTGSLRTPAKIRIRAAAAPWQHIRPMGEDMVATQLVLPAGHVIRPVDLGAAAGSGNDHITVARKPRVAILPTGSELVEIGRAARSGEIIEYNSVVLAAQVNGWGGQAARYPITADDKAKIKKIVTQAAQAHDLVLLNAGSSAGAEDFSAGIISELGEVLVHGVAVRPGHPVILGIIHGKNGKKTPVIGVPGYPVSAALTAEIFVQPLLAAWQGRRPDELDQIEAQLTRKITSPGGDDDFVRVVLGRVGERLLAAPISRGAGVISSLVRADGILRLPAGVQGEPAGAKVNIHLYRRPRDLEKTIFAIGSHDMTLDIIAQMLSQADRRLVSANVGSLGGLAALRRGEAHMAGSHLLDTQSGDYNLSYIKEYLPGRRVVVLGMVERAQGLILMPGNPKHITGLEDLIKPDIRMVNRQRGAGTRVLLDHHLSLAGLSPGEIAGYQDEEYTHLAVASSVASGKADCGLGIAAAAAALDLEFVPLFMERYDLVIPQEFFDSSLLQPLLLALKSAELQKAINALAGYQTPQIGETIAVLE